MNTLRHFINEELEKASPKGCQSYLDVLHRKILRNAAILFKRDLKKGIIILSEEDADRVIEHLKYCPYSARHEAYKNKSIISSELLVICQAYIIQAINDF